MRPALYTSQFFTKPSNMNIYISNLDSAIGNDELKQIFSTYGVVRSAEIMHDVVSQESRGFGYVEMDDASARKAIACLHQTEIQALVVNVQEDC